MNRVAGMGDGRGVHAFAFAAERLEGAGRKLEKKSMSWKIGLFAFVAFVVVGLELIANWLALDWLVRMFLLAFFALVGGGFAVLLIASLLASAIAVVVKLLPVRKVPLRYSLRNLVVRWRTTVATGLAFTVVVALLTVMLAFVHGMVQLTEGSGIPGNVLILMDGATDEVFSNLPTSASIHELPVDIRELVIGHETGDYLATKEVYVLVNHELANPEPGGRPRRFVQMRGLDDPERAGRVHGLELLKGTWWSKSGVRDVTATVDGKTVTIRAKEVVMGDGVAAQFARDLQLPAIEPGQLLKIGPLQCVAVGILKSTGSTFGSEVWTVDRTVQDQFGRTNSYSSYVGRTHDLESARIASEKIRNWKGASLQAFPETEYYAKLSETNNQFLFAIIFVAIFMAVGGVLGIMNTMFAAISQRTKDIGVMRLLGFTRGQVLVSFLFESLMIALLGGLVGCFLGWLADGFTASSIVSGGPGGGGKSVVLRLLVSPAILAIGLVFALIMGAVGGLVPALSAMRLKPLESLR